MMLKTCKRKAPCTPMAPVTHITVRSDSSLENAYHSTVSLSVPGEDEVCPITLERMSEYELDFLPGYSFRKGHPTYKKLTMSCGHSFSAMALIYHFRKNQLSCPMCREGTTEKIHPSCVPFHFKTEMLRKIAQDEVVERNEQEREDFATAMSFFDTDVSASNALIRELLNHVNLLVYFYSGDSHYPSMMQQFSMALQSTLEAGESSVSFRLPNWYVRQLRLGMRHLPETSKIVFVLSTRDLHGHVVQLDRAVEHINTLLFHDSDMTKVVQTHNNDSTLRLFFLHGMGNSPPEIESIYWTLPWDFVKLELLDRPLSAAREMMDGPSLSILVMEEASIDME